MSMPDDDGVAQALKLWSGWPLSLRSPMRFTVSLRRGGGGERNGVGSIAKSTIGIYPKEENRGKSVRNNSSFTFSPGIFIYRLK